MYYLNILQPLAALTPITLLHAQQGLFDRFASSTVKTGHMRVILPNGGELVYGSPNAEDVVFEVRMVAVLVTQLRVV